MFNALFYFYELICNSFSKSDNNGITWTRHRDTCLAHLQTPISILLENLATTKVGDVCLFAIYDYTADQVNIFCKDSRDEEEWLIATIQVTDKEGSSSTLLFKNHGFTIDEISLFKKIRDPRFPHQEMGFMLLNE